MHLTRTRFFCWTAAAACALFLGAAGALSVIGLRDQVVDTDLAIIPGNTVFPDGTLSARLMSRLDAVLPLYRGGHVRVILVSGGIGAEGQDEAAAMKDYLVRMGVPAAAIITDNQGINTYETARFAAALIRKNGYRPPMLVSQFFHIARFELALEKHGIAAGGHVHARYLEGRDAYSLAREVVGYVGYTFREN